MPKIFAHKGDFFFGRFCFYHAYGLKAGIFLIFCIIYNENK